MMFSLGRRWSEGRVEEIMSILLRTGVVISSAIVLGGGIYYLIKHGMQIPQYHVFQGVPETYQSIRGIFSSAYSLSARGTIDIGLLVLMATPIARVAFGLYAFARQRDRVYVVATSIVLAVLIYNLLGSYL